MESAEVALTATQRKSVTTSFFYEGVKVRVRAPAFLLRGTHVAHLSPREGTMSTQTQAVEITVIHEVNEVVLGDFDKGTIPFETPEAALEAAEKTCYAGNRLTAPYSGIETRNTVIADSNGSFRTATFLIGS